MESDIGELTGSCDMRRYQVILLFVYHVMCTHILVKFLQPMHEDRSLFIIMFIVIILSRIVNLFHDIPASTTYLHPRHFIPIIVNREKSIVELFQYTGFFRSS